MPNDPIIFGAEGAPEPLAHALQHEPQVYRVRAPGVALTLTLVAPQSMSWPDFVDLLDHLHLTASEMATHGTPTPTGAETLLRRALRRAVAITRPSFAGLDCRRRVAIRAPEGRAIAAMLSCGVSYTQEPEASDA